MLVANCAKRSGLASINITCPASPECSKTSTMSNIVKSAKFVFKLDDRPSHHHQFHSRSIRYEKDFLPT